MAYSEKEIKLKEMASQFSNLTMKNPGKIVTDGGHESLINHPYQFILASFPTYQSFYNYFSELALEYRTMGSYEEFLQSLYNNIIALGHAIENMNEGTEPERLNLMLRSFQMFMKMSQRKYQLSSTRLTRVHAN